jgi:exodeoxyribonuclease VII large subunit
LLKNNVYTVAQVNSYIKGMFNQDFLLRKLTVKGEVSNCKYHSSGHIYFTLKDPSGTLNCVMFRGNRNGLKFQMTEGQQVQVTGSCDVYVKGGSYQLYATNIEPDGTGQLYEKYEQLKKKLEELGMFSPEYKQEIPKYIRTLGVVTAPTGAAVRDIISITRRRNPYVQIILYPAIVQGVDAPASIVRGLQVLASTDVDVIIVGRGGGSIEDLWAFNDESVAQAIFDCPIPIISAVGHETDTTIADYVADLRAPTPSAAAELAVYEYQRFMSDIEDYRNILYGQLDATLSSYKHELKVRQSMLRAYSPWTRIRDRRMRQADYVDTLNLLWKQQLLKKKNMLDIRIEKMKGLSPLDKLKSGFSYVEDESGNNIKSVSQTAPGKDIKVKVTDGTIYAKTISTDTHSMTS